jgi:hypothetical protein
MMIKKKQGVRESKVPTLSEERLGGVGRVEGKE